jgi:hypothetical protein
MIDDLIALQAPQGTKRIYIDFTMETEQDVRNEAHRRGKETFYIPNETNRAHIMFRDDDSGVMKTFIAEADPK